MTEINLHISANNAQEFANALLGVIGTIGHLARPTAPTAPIGANAHGIGPDTDAGPNPEYRADEAEDAKGEPIVAAEPDEKPKRTRRTKAEMEAARAADAAVAPEDGQSGTEEPATEAAEETAEKAEEVPAEQEKAAPITNEELWAKLDIVIKQASVATAGLLLGKYKVRKARDLTDEQRPVFLAEINKAIAIIESAKRDPEKNAEEIKKVLKLG